MTTLPTPLSPFYPFAPPVGPALQCKLLREHAKAPTKAHASDAGYDLCACWSLEEKSVAKIPLHMIPPKVIPPGARLLIETGVAVACPLDVCFQIWPRSGLALKSGLDVLGGLVDSGYRGEVKVILQNHGTFDVEIKYEERIAQLVPVKLFCDPKASNQLSLTEVQEFSETDRQANGFGSTSR